MKRPQRHDRRGSKVQQRPAHASTRERLVQIEKPIYGGDFLARDEGKAVFVPLSLPGEQVRVRLIEEKRGYAKAELEEIVSTAPERVTPGCRHFGTCGGCQYQHANYVAQLRMKESVLRETLQRGGVEVPVDIDVLAGDPWHYRNRIRLALDAQGNPGYRGRRSHAVVPINECPIAAPLLVNAALDSAQAARELGFRLTEMAMFCDANESSLLVSLFTASADRGSLDRFARSLKERIPQLAGVELVMEGREEGAARALARWGAESLNYRVGGSDYRVDHGAFFQVNRYLVDALAERVTGAERGRLAWDLFAGVGLFAKRLAGQFDRVVAVESAPTATAALSANLDGTGGIVERSGTLESLERNKDGERPDMIVVDPPRTGLGAEIASLLAHVAAPLLVYVSCDPATLARDLRVLTAEGYRIESATLIDLFPQTFHLETLVRLRRA